MKFSCLNRTIVQIALGHLPNASAIRTHIIYIHLTNHRINPKCNQLCKMLLLSGIVYRIVERERGGGGIVLAMNCAVGHSLLNWHNLCQIISIWPQGGYSNDDDDDVIYAVVVVFFPFHSLVDSSSAAVIVANDCEQLIIVMSSLLGSFAALV